MKLLVGSIVLLLICACLAFAGAVDKEKVQAVDKTTVNDLYRPFLINNVFNYYSNNGDGSYNKFSSDNEGFEFPKGGGNHVIFEDGVVWGGFHKGRTTPKVGGSVYRHGLQAGKILTNGTATTDPVADAADAAKYRVFRVRPDINPKTPLNDEMRKKIHDEEVVYISRYESYTEQDIYDQYIKDWNEWPAADGAPYDDVNHNGTYEPATDIPGQKGADQTLWYVANDMSATRATNLAGSPPIGIEMQRTIWGYNRTGALGSTIFASSLLINKSGAKIDSMYLVQWSDPDLGNAGDDLAGCDVSRSLGYIYNGKPVDANYGSVVPAGGFTFFQGPKVPSPGDSAIFKLKYVQGYKNLKMSSFVYFTQGNATYADPAQGGGGDIEWYRLMNGFVAKTGAPFIDPKTGQASKFTLSGDPVTGQGWIDGKDLPPADRRICLVTGPFTMAVGDTQELVVANVGGLGSDRISSIAVLRYYSDLAQSAYNGLFNIPQAPPAPKLGISAIDGTISLNWGDPAEYTKLESFSSVGYSFEGYNVYQLPGPSFSNAKRLATYDIPNLVTVIFDDAYDPATGYVLKKPVQFGSDGGLQRVYSTKKDAINDRNLVNGTKYYFAVTSYSYNPSPTAKPSNLESPPIVREIIPESPKPGNRYSAVGDTVKVVQSGAPSEGQVIPIVVDPTRILGHAYKVAFHNDASGNTLWDVQDLTTGAVKVRNQTNQSGDDDYPVIDGMLVKVTGPPTGGMKDWQIPNGTRRFTWADADGFAMEGFNGAMGNAHDNWLGSTSLGYDKLKNTLLKLATADGTWDPKVKPADPNYSKGYRYLRSATSAAAKPEFAPWIINKTAGYAYQDFNYSVPFSAWDVEANPPVRLSVGHLENNQSGGIVDGRYWPPANGAGVTNTASTGPREWFFIFDTPYSETANAALTVDALNTELPMMWFGTPNRRGGANFTSGDEFLILANHLNTPATVFTFTSTKPMIADNALAQVDVDKVNVFPNPYIGYNTQEINKYARFVTFNHLPAKATIRIFNLSGVLIKTIVKDDATTQFATWDLANQNGFPASAGMYIAYIEMPEVGKTKTLKLGIIPEQQYLDRW